jgi:hypothetical protein
MHNSGDTMMPIDDPNDLACVDQEIRINELREEANELADGQMTHYESEDCPPGLAESFWQHVVNYEKAPWTSSFQCLLEGGVALPTPEELSDDDLTAKLWEVVHHLEKRRTFLSTTDHLSDRELYTYLWSHVLHEAYKDMPFDPYSAHQIDLLSSGSDEDTFLYMKYFADADYRNQWMTDFPDYGMPDHVQPPFDRDRRLPKATYGDPDEYNERSMA